MAVFALSKVLCQPSVPKRVVLLSTSAAQRALWAYRAEVYTQPASLLWRVGNVRPSLDLLGWSFDRTQLLTFYDIGVSESLYGELSPFGIRIILVEPGAFGTNLVNRLVMPVEGLSKPYEGTPADEVLQRTKAMAGARLGDPKSAAQRILDVITGTGMGGGEEVKGCLRVPLGKDCMKVARAKWTSFGRNLDVMEEIAASTGFGD